MGRYLDMPMTTVAVLLAVVGAAYAITAWMVWRTYRRNYRE